jgi:hypothetical protein
MRIKMEEVLEKMEAQDWFTVLDTKEAYCHIEIVEDHKYKTAFEFEG